MGELHSLESVLARFEKTLASDDEIARWERRREEQARSELLALSGIGEVLTTGGADAVGRDQCESTRALELVRQWLASRVPVLALFGPRGVGKTVAAAWGLARTPGRYIEAASLCTMRRENFGAPSEGYLRAARAGLLVVDELGTEPNIDDAQATLHDIVNRRQRLPRRTLLLGNLDRGAFLARYDGRTLDRLREIAAIRKIDGDSMRKGAL
jgi:DNA replication protein DnaC